MISEFAESESVGQLRVDGSADQVPKPFHKRQPGDKGPYNSSVWRGMSIVDFKNASLTQRGQPIAPKTVKEELNLFRNVLNRALR